MRRVITGTHTYTHIRRNVYGFLAENSKHFLNFPEHQHMPLYSQSSPSLNNNKEIEINISRRKVGSAPSQTNGVFAFKLNCTNVE